MYEKAQILVLDSPYEEQDRQIHLERARTDKYYWRDMWRYKNSQRREKQYQLEAARADKNFWLDHWRRIICQSRNGIGIGGRVGYPSLGACILPGHDLVFSCSKCRYSNSFYDKREIRKSIQELVKTHGIRYLLQKRNYGDFYISKASIKRLRVVFGNVSESDAIKKLEDTIIRS